MQSSTDVDIPPILYLFGVMGWGTAAGLEYTASLKYICSLRTQKHNWGIKCSLSARWQIVFICRHTMAQGQFNVGGPATCSQVMFKNSPTSAKYSFSDRTQILHLVYTCHPTLGECDTRFAKCGESEIVNRYYVKNNPIPTIIGGANISITTDPVALVPCWKNFCRGGGAAVPWDRTLLDIFFRYALSENKDTFESWKLVFF